MKIIVLLFGMNRVMRVQYKIANIFCTNSRMYLFKAKICSSTMNIRIKSNFKIKISAFVA